MMQSLCAIAAGLPFRGCVVGLRKVRHDQGAAGASAVLDPVPRCGRPWLSPGGGHATLNGFLPFGARPRPAGETLMPPSPSLSTGSPSRRLMRAFRISVALAIIAATSWLMTHQVQAPSVYSDRPPSIGTSDMTASWSGRRGSSAATSRTGPSPWARRCDRMIDAPFPALLPGFQPSLQHYPRRSAFANPRPA
jgi:hypothetical protein